MNIRHDLDPALVAAHIEKRLIDHEKTRDRLKSTAIVALLDYQQAIASGNTKRWPKAPEGPGYVDPMIDEWVERERTDYAKVRVIQMEEGFRLVYGDADDATVKDGTGPFETLEKASAWFFNGGR